MPTNVELVARNYELFAAGDLAGLSRAYAEDGVLVHHGPESAPTRGEWKKQDLGGYFHAVGSSVDITRFDVQRLLADGDTVVALVDLAFTARSSGRAWEGRSVHVTTLRDGLTERVEIFASEPESLY